ncbi:hypothetical protein EVAR_68513_1 [Eumeta japonica]|uniref:Uncharacterized protein n=1 Tax=Eumeta variegata TaxID=151549 RepID=A0A4C1ZBT2_EUMVA|nr:hypothetical protein EVAR_68513_1 [Eumeta japonica]
MLRERDFCVTPGRFVLSVRKRSTIYCGAKGRDGRVVFVCYPLPPSNFDSAPLQTFHAKNNVFNSSLCKANRRKRRSRSVANTGALTDAFTSLYF